MSESSEREAFEKSLLTGDLRVDKVNVIKCNGIYASDRIQARWEGWQTRAKVDVEVDVDAIRETIVEIDRLAEDDSVLPHIQIPLQYATDKLARALNG